MAGKVMGILCIIGFIFGIINGETEAVSRAATESAGKAVNLAISLTGMMGLWGGIMRVAEKSGATSIITKIMTPAMKFLFPDAVNKNNGIPEIAAAVTANMLGMGNVSTPLSLKAMEKLKENCDGIEPSPDMTVFTVISCFPFTLIPTTLITIRQAAGSSSPAEIVPAVWIVSLVSFVFSAFVSYSAARCRIKSKKTQKQRKSNKIKCHI